MSDLPPHFDVDKIHLSILFQKELECWQLNTQVTNYLCSVLSYDVQDVIYGECEIDAHLIWEMLEELYGSPKCIDQEQTEEESLDECSTST